MFKSIPIKSVTWPSGTFMLLFCIWCCYCFSYNIMLVDGVPSYANVSTSWSSRLRDDILVSQSNGTYHSFTLRFINSSQLDYMENIEYNLAIILNSNYDYLDSTLVWFTNQSGHAIVGNYGATLEFTKDGDLVLTDARNGKIFWSTNTSGLSVERMHLKDDGNLVLLNGKGHPVWESYSHQNPTNTLLNAEQGLSVGQRLTSNTSPFNTTIAEFYVEWGIDGIHAYVDHWHSPQQYKFWDYQSYNATVSRHLKYTFSQEEYSYMFLDVDAHLKWVDWVGSTPLINEFWDEIDSAYDKCSYPTVCGEYGICKDKECRCPMGNEGNLIYFEPINVYNPSLGCTLVTPLSCTNHGFLELNRVTYFDSIPSLVGVDVESCKKTCLYNCSCKAVFFHYYEDSSFGNCTLPSEIHTLMDVSNRSLGHEVLTFLKVQSNASKKTSSKRNIVIFVSTSFVFLVLATRALCLVFMREKNSSKDDFSLKILVNTISRFSIESLKLATQNFQSKLGRGGFGSVYEGTLIDGTKVAVKCLESCRQGTKEFLAEVNTIGSIHHFNLVRLIGFCDDGLNRLLVYEYMCNGSLDRWIFNDGVCQTLTWSIRRRIIEGVAAGLEYLHEHCQKNVIHFDIKPQNILLDKDFNVKISDFGLAKMVDRDESQVMTVVRGTPGYIAPELMNNSAISVKVDVYSLGVVILEIVCGR